ncbi:MAG: RidA family protein [Aquificae bacterium]|nr:RidA family protein [Aquificota bacterium]
MEFVKTDRAPAAVGPYSQAVKVGNWLFVSGQIALNPETGKLEGETAAEQTERILKNLKAILEAAGFDLKEVVKVTIYTTDLEEFPKINEVYARFFGDHRPARATVGVCNLPLGAKVELEAVAFKGP